jgi:bilirubin oxidase
MSVHVHGQYNRAPFDGWAADYANPGQYKDYYYPNAQNARTIWYHVSTICRNRHPKICRESKAIALLPCATRSNINQDHTEFETAENAYRGQEGFYIITDSQEQALGLPSGKYDIPLALAAKEYNSDGSLRFETNGNFGLYGDIIQVYVHVMQNSDSSNLE